MEEGLAIVASDGPRALTIARLASGVNLTKGSFYHHFQDRQDFVSQLLADWEKTDTEGIIESAEAANSNQKIRELGRLTASINNDKERIIRGWAQVDPFVADFVQRVDHRRQKYVEKLARAITGDHGKARLMARLVYSVFVGAGQIYPPLNQRELKQIYAALEGMLDSPSS